MELETIKTLIEQMSNSKLSALDIDLPDGTKLHMKKENNQAINIQAPHVINEKLEVAKLENVEPPKEPKRENAKIIKSPMVGTFYSKPSPTSEPFVRVGTSIKRGDTVCIIEAMKLMNELDSEFDGVIKEILVEDGEPVDYGKELFIIE